MTTYTATIQHADLSCAPGYQERLDDLTIDADGEDDAFAAAFAARPQVTRVTLTGIVGGPYFDGAAWHRYRRGA